jgi:aspartyl/asparaginyl-tRNA synthetase
MIPKYILDKIEQDNIFFSKFKRKDFYIPNYNPLNHYLCLTENKYFVALLCLRSHIKSITDYYFGTLVDARSVDLFMLTSSVSSPVGLGSNSEVVVAKLGNIDSFLTDSSQFGFEPLLLNEFDKVYCYMPSMRGENCDKRHLNQFFHCEIEIRGELDVVKKIAEEYVKIMCETILASSNIIRLISANVSRTKEVLEKVMLGKKFQNISFDEAVEILEKKGLSNLVNYTFHGRDICSDGEIQLMKQLNTDMPVWLNNFDRDIVPFYQKPDKNNQEKTVNADFLFPPLQEGAFGGEIIGSGQRQNLVSEIYESLNRQGIKSEPYEWYINLRRQKNYSITSGFGLGIERFISWALGFDDIKKTIIYPRIKNIKTFP